MLRHDRVLAVVLRFGLRLVGLYGRGVANALRPAIRRAKLEWPALPVPFDGFRILHLADFHIDGMDGLAEVLAAETARQPCDLCVLTGDYRFEVYGPCEEVYVHLRRALSGVRAKHGIMAVLGNHDAAEMAPALERLGVRLLLNEAVEVRKEGAGIWVAGVDDPHYYGCDDLPEALRAVPPDAFKILLAHSPEIYAEAAAAGIHLCFCGHTHAGQIGLPWIGAPLVNARCPRAYTHGVWRHGGMIGITSAGVGCSMLPVRYNCPPEIVLVELSRARGESSAAGTCP
jgi:predicted MPP superfamily phosphohydrolase